MSTEKMHSQALFFIFSENYVLIRGMSARIANFICFTGVTVSCRAVLANVFFFGEKLSAGVLP
jgi:hypothetical protein